MKVLIAAILLTSLAAAQEVCPPTPAWSLCEIVLPASDTTLRAEFRNPSHRTFLIQSFTVGQNQHLRIVPTEPGTWAYRLTSANSTWNGKEGSFSATPSSEPGYIEAANVHHFRYSGSKQPHLWMGDVGNHKCIDATLANEAAILAAHKAGITADLIVPAGADVPELIARYGALNITWQLLPNWDREQNGRESARRAAGIIRALDQYHHLIAPAFGTTAGPLAQDGWIGYLTYRSSRSDVAAIEHQVYAFPAVSDFGAGLTDANDFRHALWRMTMGGAYPQSQPPDETAAAQLRHWYEFLSATRYWELEPFFDAEGRPALALEGVEYLVYVEQPGPVTVTVDKHNYDVAWFDPATGEQREEKNLKTETFSGNPPDATHDWVLHISREGHKAGMLKSYKFESREVLQQEVETAKVPFEIAQPAGESISLSHPGPFAARITKDSKAARALRFLWTAEVTADGQSYRVVGSGQQGQLDIPEHLAVRLPALLHLRVEGLNGVGKLYALDRNYQLTP